MKKTISINDKSIEVDLLNLQQEEIHFELEGETLMIAPAAGFYGTLSSGKNQVRIAYVLNQDSLLSAIKILKEALAVYPGRVN